MVNYLIPALTLALIIVIPLKADYDDEASVALVLAASRPYQPNLPSGAKHYAAAQWTQSIFKFTGDPRAVIRPVTIDSLPDARWHQPGGMDGIKGWTTEKFRTIPAEPKLFTVNKLVTTDIGSQYETGLDRTYADGTRFDELLINSDSKTIFEHRVREKIDGKWKSSIIHSNEQARPEGYTGLKAKCSSCHDEAGTGGYGVGLVPGGDGVLSDPLPWHLSSQSPESNKFKKTESSIYTPRITCTDSSLSLLLP